MAATPTVTLATLIRGKTYSHHVGDGTYMAFSRNIPKPVDDDLADILEELTESIGTEDDEVIETERFRIERNVPASRINPEHAEPVTRFRTRMVREEVPVRQPVTTRKVPVIPAPGKKPTGFGRRTTGV